eukprot:gene5601-1002_t
MDLAQGGPNSPSNPSSPMDHCDCDLAASATATVNWLLLRPGCHCDLGATATQAGQQYTQAVCKRDVRSGVTLLLPHSMSKLIPSKF